MCGIAGALSQRLDADERAIFKSLMAMSTIRGPYGSGVVGLRSKRGEKPHVLHNTGTGAGLVYSPEGGFEEAFKGDHSLFLGHCRLPTRGTDGPSDLHPIVADHIIGVHNGTMDRVAGEKVEKGALDSRMIFQSFANIGPVDTLLQSEGAYALAWINTKDETLNFVRNKDRGLALGHWGQGYDPYTFFWASETMLLWAAMARYKEKPNVFYIDPGKIYSFPLRPHRQLSPQIRDLTKPAPIIPVDQSVLPFDGTKIDRSALSSSKHSDVPIRDVRVPAIVETARNCFVAAGQLIDYLDDGCVMCNAKASVAECLTKNIIWVSRQHYVCRRPECMNDGLLAQLYPGLDDEYKWQTKSPSYRH